MRKLKIEKIVSMAMAAIMVFSMCFDAFAVTASATLDTTNQAVVTETETIPDTGTIPETTPEATPVADPTPRPTAEPTPRPTPTPEPTPQPTPVSVCTLCGGEGHTDLDCPNKCKEHGTAHLDVNCSRHITCSLCSLTGHEIADCPSQCTEHGTQHLDTDCPRHSTVCTLCGKTGHEAADCPSRCVQHGTRHMDKDCPRNFATNDNVYITNYQVVDENGNPLAQVRPGDKVIVAVTVIDERVRAEDFGNLANSAQTDRIHATMAQGAFTIPYSGNIKARIRNNVSVNGTSGSYNALCYTIEFRDVTYLGGTPDFSFSIAYTDYDSNPLVSNNTPLPYPQKTLSLSVTQATDDVPAPTVILNSANYGKVAIIGEPFSLVTTATNTSSNLELDNVSVKVVLPAGINMASGNSQVLVGTVGKSGTINHTFNLIAEGVANDVTSLPVQLVYTFEAFVNGKRTQFTSTQDISINVQQPTRFAIQSVTNDAEMYLNNESYISASLVNKGKTTVYNVTAELVSETLTAYEVEFLGNITPGSSSEASFDFTASQLGTSTGKILITYEDAQGTETTMEQEFAIEVIEEPVWDEPMYTEPAIDEPETSVSPVIVVGVLAVAAAGGFFFWKKKQAAKRKAELEDEDEDI